MQPTEFSRREVVKASVAAMLAGQTGLRDAAVADEPTSNPKTSLRVGFVGIGNKGSQHVRNLLHIDGVEMLAVCDILTEPCVRTQRLCKQLGMREPVAYTGGEYEFRRMCDEQDLDLVYTATPWRWHAPVCLAALNSGKHAATEIPAAISLDDCWQLVETHEKTGKHVSMMENVNYCRTEMSVLRMVREGVLGELVHAEAGYMHDTRYLKIRDFGDGLWLGAHHAQRNGNLYPTHGLGPLAWYTNLGRGNRMEYLVSMSSKARGMNLFAKEHLPKDHPYRKRDYINGDVNSSLIKTANGETLIIKHDTDLPRPYSRINLVQGTRGIVRGFPEFLVSLENRDQNRHKHLPYQSRPMSEHYEQFDHPLWTEILSIAEQTPEAADGFKLADEIRSGDYLEDMRLVQAHLRGVAPDYDVYDAAAWSVVSALSEKSVANRSQAVDFPDFTRGKWKSRAPLKIMGV